MIAPELMAESVERGDPPAADGDPRRVRPGEPPGRPAALALVAVAAITAAGTAGPLPEISCARFAEGFTSPTVMIPYGSGERAFLVADQVGTISLLAAGGGRPGETFLDLRERMVRLNDGFDDHLTRPSAAACTARIRSRRTDCFPVLSR